LNKSDSLFTHINLETSVLQSSHYHNESNSLRFQFYLTTVPSKNIQLDHNQEEGEEDLLALDSSCQSSSSSSSSGVESIIISLVIDIMIHPSYLIPCPYISVHDSTGSIVSLDQLDKALAQTHHDNSFSFRFSSASLIETEHPNTSQPCFTLHVCGVKEYMDTVRLSCGTAIAGVDLLRWFSSVGPQFGMSISPVFFTSAFDRLSQM
jgi:hypothetical protein